MYCVTLTVQPTAAMTFRILPSSILNIATYPFVPPTTLSGFLRRLGMLSVGLELPETAINKNKPPVYALPNHYTALGAYANPHKWSGVHRTHRKGMREFNHDEFSRLYVEKGKVNFQLHTWEYFLAEELTGYVVSNVPQGLEHFQDLESYGCKLGKEGFAVVTKVSEIIELSRATIKAYPSTIVPMEALLLNNQFVGGCDIYNLYRYNWKIIQESNGEAGFLDHNATPVDGFIPFVTALYQQKQEEHFPTLDYYTNGEINIPADLINLLRGEVHA